MRLTSAVLAVLMALALAVTAPIPAQAGPPWLQQVQDRSGRARDHDRRGQRPAVSLGRAVAQAEARTGGRVLSAQTRQENGRPVYRIKVLTPGGRVRVLVMDARTGRWR
ncbi:MAG TPA: PepSY domain-containing protein [Gammaproteobacteria bacterium]|nr:PepSY domain-containing protein [Gammaproteobacteria bacterium]